MKQFNLNEYLANPSKKVVTRDGREVKIHCTNYHLSNQCIIAEIKGIAYSFSFNKYGQPYGYEEENPLDLFFATEKHEGWVNLYRDWNNKIYSIGNIYDSEEKAINNRCEEAIATVKIEWEE